MSGGPWSPPRRPPPQGSLSLPLLPGSFQAIGFSIAFQRRRTSILANNCELTQHFAKLKSPEISVKRCVRALPKPMPNRVFPLTQVSAQILYHSVVYCLINRFC